MKKLNKVYVAFIMALFFHLSYSQEPLSFRDAEDIMLNYNKELKVKDKAIEVGGYNLAVAKSLSYPQIKAIGSAVWMNKDISLDLNGIKDKAGDLLEVDPGTLGSWDFTLQKKDIQFAGVGLAWPVYAGGKIKALRESARIDNDIRKNDKNISEQTLISELANGYFQTKLAAEAVGVYKMVLEGMKQHLYNAQKMEQNGMVAASETLQAKVAVAEADRQVLAGKKDFLLTKDALANAMGVDSIADSLSSSFFILPGLMPLGDFQKKAVDNYPKIVKLKLLEKIAEQQVLTEKADHLPSLSLTGQKVVASNNFPLIKNPLIVGANLTYNIFDGFGRKNKIKAAEGEREALILTREKAQEDIMTLVDKLYKQLQKDEEQVNSLNVSKALAMELLRVRQKGFSESVTSSVDVVDAELNFSSVALQTLQAYYNYDTTLAQLYELAGISGQYVELIK